MLNSSCFYFPVLTIPPSVALTAVMGLSTEIKPNKTMKESKKMPLSKSLHSFKGLLKEKQNKTQLQATKKGTRPIYFSFAGHSSTSKPKLGTETRHSNHQSGRLPCISQASTARGAKMSLYVVFL